MSERTGEGEGGRRYGPAAPTSRGRRMNGVYVPVSAENGSTTGGLQPGTSNDANANQLEAKVVIRQSTLLPSFLLTDAMM